MNYQETIDLLLNTFPDFSEAWQKHLDYWEGDERTIGIDLSAFTSFISKKLKHKEPYDFKKVFDFIEKILIEGDQDVQNAAATQFLESLVNFSSWKHFDSRDFTKFLGPESIAYCKAWDEFTGSKTDGIYEDEEI